MTYTFKLSRRLAASNMAMLALLLGACSAADSVAPSTDLSDSNLVPELATASAPGYPIITFVPKIDSMFVGDSLATRTSMQETGSIHWGRCVLFTISDTSVIQISTTPAGNKCVTSSAGKYVSLKAKKTGVAILRAASLSATYGYDTIRVVAKDAPIVAISLTPGTSAVGSDSTRQFNAVGIKKDSTTVPVTVTYTATGGTIASTGLYKAGATAGTYRVVAKQQNGTMSDTASVTVTAPAPAPAPAPVPAPSGAMADPTLLQAATTQVKNVTAYTALKVPAMVGGTSYRDPVTGVRVWKVTSPSVPASNTGAGHDYSEGPVQVSREWGGNKHTMLVRVDGRPYYLVDLTRGVGLSNWRMLPSGASPAGNQAASFSQNPATPQILYVVTGSAVVRVNTATNRIENTGNFGMSVPLGTWLTIDKNDTWFVGFGKASGTVTAWNSVTGEVRTKAFSGLDEPYFERDGRYILANNGSKTSTVWDLQTNTTRSITAPGNSNWGHNPALRGFFVTYDVNSGAGQIPTWRVDPVQGATQTQISTLGGYAPDAHSAGQWVQSDAELPGGDIRKQWFIRTTYNWSYAAYGNGVKEGVGFLRADGSDYRLLAHHYSVNAGSQDRYWSQPHGTISPDGKIVLFDSNMNNGASPNRNDLFAIEVPTR